MLGTILGALANKTGTNPGQDFQEQSAALQGADPSMILRQLEQLNQILGILFVRTFQTLPNLSNQISATMKQLSRAIKEGQQASGVSETVKKADGGSPPIDFSAASSGMPGQSTGQMT